MTTRVGSRFYRAPELILCKPDYDQAVDIWAAGCILGELLLNFVENIDSEQNAYQNRTEYLFAGDSCYPLSPMIGHESLEHANDECHLSQNDQLLKIFDVLGSPSEDEIESLTNNDPDKSKYINQLIKTVKETKCYKD